MNGKHLLLAEDDLDDVSIFKETLADLTPDVTLTVAENGVLLMNLLKGGLLPDLIFLDLNMPLKNGMQCLDEIKHCDKLSTVKVIVLSTSAHPEQIKTVYQKGADLYLTKSTSYSDFKNALSRCLELDWAALHPPEGR